MKNLLKYLLVFGVLSLPIGAKAAHIIGGDMTYRCLDVDSINQVTLFEITVTMYRDSKGGGAGFDDPARFGVYRGQGFGWTFIEEQRIRVRNVRDLTYVDDPCVTIPSNVGVQSGTYVFQVYLPWTNQTYKVAYQRCCRNNTITNLVSPESTGAVFEVNITPEALTSCNNSPTFNSFPPIVLCANNPVQLDLSATDVDGDQLVYEFCAPKASGGQSPGTGCDAIIPRPTDCLPPFDFANFRLPLYSVSKPLGDNAATQLDPATGKLSLRPLTLGQFVVGVCVKEFRNGKLISEISRDFQFNIAGCEDLVSAKVQTASAATSVDETDDELIIESCFNKVIEFNNLSTSAFGNPTYLWEFDFDGQLFQDFNTNTTVNFPEIGTYYGSLIVNPQNGVCSDTAKIKVVIHPETRADFSYEYDTCVAGPVQFSDLTATGSNFLDSWQWDFADNESSETQNPIHRYKVPGTKTIQLIVTDANGCIDTIVKNIDWRPVPDVIIIEPSEFVGCIPATIFFNNLSSPIDDTYDITWNFGDGNTAQSISPEHVFTQAGKFDVEISIVSPEGCLISKRYPKLIEVEEAPQADFEVVYENIDEKQIQFINKSENAEGWQWLFDTGWFTFDESPNYTFPDTGVYRVELIAYHRLGCTDSLTQWVDISPFFTFYLPNAFTPNNDGLNDTFEPSGMLNGIKDFEMTIFNRWGSKVFESRDINVGWNGEIANSGKLCPQGVYVYQVTYREPRGKQQTHKGHFTVIR